MSGELCPIYGRVYLITNLVNDKKYVGQTTFSSVHRFGRHFNNAKHDQGWDNYFYRSLRKYGKENFSIRELCVCFSKTELDIMEDLHIANQDSMNKETGYNIRRGGAHGKFSEESKERCSASKRGRKHSPETRQKMKDTAIRNRHLRLGKKASLAARHKMSVSRRGKKCHKYRHDVDTSFVILLYSVGYAARDISHICSVDPSTVSDRLKKAGVELDPYRRRRTAPIVH